MSVELPIPSFEESRFLNEFCAPDQVPSLAALTQARQSWLTWKPFAPIREMWPHLPQLDGAIEVRDGAVHFGESLAEADPIRRRIHDAARAVSPWKKGPFNLWGMPLDAEWRSDFKWDRLVPALPALEGLDLLDVGTHNGYYMYRMLEQKPRYVLGIDPVPRLWYQFHLLQKLCVPNCLEFQMWGWQEMAGWQACFDGIFCMGILYHHPDPIGLLRNLYQALKPGGFLVLESITIPGDTSTCLFPEGRYAMMRNVWFLPTVLAMKNMLGRTKFLDIECVADQPHLPEEQRTTEWNPGPSHEDFMMPGDLTRTCEGHPAPRRAMLIARKRG